MISGGRSSLLCGMRASMTFTHPGSLLICPLGTFEVRPPNLTGVFTHAIAELLVRLPRSELKVIPARGTGSGSLRKALRHATALSGAEDRLPEDARDEFPADQAVAFRQLGRRIAVVLPAHDASCECSLNRAVLVILEQDQRDGHDRTRRFDDLCLSAVRSHPPLDLDVVSAVNQEIWRVGVSRAVWEWDGESVRLVLVRHAHRVEVARVVRFPSRPDVVPDVFSKADHAERVFRRRRTIGRLPPASRVLARRRAELPRRLRWRSVDGIPADAARNHVPSIAGRAESAYSGIPGLDLDRHSAALTGNLRPFSSTLAASLCSARMAAIPTRPFADEGESTSLTGEGFHRYIIARRGAS